MTRGAAEKASVSAHAVGQLAGSLDNDSLICVLQSVPSDDALEIFEIVLEAERRLAVARAS